MQTLQTRPWQPHKRRAQSSTAIPHNTTSTVANAKNGNYDTTRRKCQNLRAFTRCKRNRQEIPSFTAKSLPNPPTAANRPSEKVHRKNTFGDRPPMNRSEAAFRLSFRRLALQYPKLYHWTFTFIKTQNDWLCPACFEGFKQQLQRAHFGLLRGLRVTELHLIHGIHFHVILNERVSVHLVRRLAKKWGFGRVQVQQVDEGTEGYLAKYLCKTAPRFFGRMRRWSPIGGALCRVSDVRVSSPSARFLHRVKRQIGGFQCHGEFLTACQAQAQIKSLTETVNLCYNYRQNTRSENDAPQSQQLERG